MPRFTMSSLLFSRRAAGRCGSAKPVSSQQDAIAGIYGDGSAMCDKSSLKTVRSGRLEQPTVSLYVNQACSVAHNVCCGAQDQRSARHIGLAKKGGHDFVPRREKTRVASSRPKSFNRSVTRNLQRHVDAKSSLLGWNNLAKMDGSLRALHDISRLGAITGDISVSAAPILHCTAFGFLPILPRSGICPRCRYAPLLCDLTLFSASSTVIRALGIGAKYRCFQLPAVVFANQSARGWDIRS